MNKGSKFAISTVVAAGVGYVAGILTAPKSGKQTRKDVKDQAAQAKVQTEKKLKELNNELTVLLNRVKDKAKTAEAETKAQIHKAVERGVMAKDKTREILSAFHEGETEDKDLQKAVSDVHKAIDHLKIYLDKNADQKPKS